MAVNQNMREQVARNLATSMKLAGVDNPNQFEKLTDAISVDQVRNILNAKSSATIDALYHIGKALGVHPAFLVNNEAVRLAVESSGVTHRDITDVISLFCDTTPEGRKMILDIAALQPKRQHHSDA